MTKKTIPLSGSALDYLDFFRDSEAALQSPGAAYVSGLVPEQRISALANLCLTYHRPLLVADMVGQPRGQMVPPREQIHARGYYAEYSQIQPPLNVPDQIAVLYLYSEDPEQLAEALRVLYPKVNPTGLVLIEGAASSSWPEVLEAGTEVQQSRNGDFYY